MFVYVITGGRRHVKIGHSKDVTKRLKGIQTGCPFTVRIAGQWKTTRAQEIERRSHSMLAKYRWAGEWFDVPVRVATLTVGMLVTANPCRNGEDKPVTKAIAFCRSCAHSGVLPYVPDNAAKFRCTKCNQREHVHIVDFIVNTLQSA